MKGKIVFVAALTTGAASAGLANVHPWGNLRAGSVASPAVLGSAQVPAGVRHLLETRCADCHSTRTRWPIYSHFAPASWLMEHDVHEARAAMDFSDLSDLSRWPAPDSAGRLRLLASIAAEVRTKRMPPPRYLLLHPDARLSDDERRAIVAWSHAERDRLRTQNPAPGEKP